jgi:hypothetical protein
MAIKAYLTTLEIRRKNRCKQFLSSLAADHVAQRNKVIISTRNSGRPKCGKCKLPLFEKFAVIFGYVYVLSNPGIPNLLKIGQTSGSIQRRVDQLGSATGVPNPFVIEAYWASEDPKSEEKLLHTVLGNCRRPGREFFELPLNDALTRCVNALSGRLPQYVRQEHGPFKEP